MRGTAWHRGWLLIAFVLVTALALAWALTAPREGKQSSDPSDVSELSNVSGAPGLPAAPGQKIGSSTISHGGPSQAASGKASATGRPSSSQPEWPSLPAPAPSE